jgi:hypothetical protein
MMPVAYWAWSYSGPYRWIAELQINSFGVYRPKITFLFTLLAVYLPLMPLAYVLPALLGGSRYRRLDRRSGQVFGWISDHWGRIFSMGMGGILAIVGVFMLISATTARKLTPVSAAQLESGNRPSGRWLEITGWLNFADSLTLKKGFNKEVYVPLVSEQWQPGQPVAVYLRLHDRQEELFAEELKGNRYQGLVSTTGLPNDVYY